jgi:enamine deaminase RidA (YjgF/YER057c/UK114 family)
MDNLPEAPKAIGNYTTIKQIGDLIYTSGHIPVTDTKKFIGKIPNEIFNRRRLPGS